MAKKSKSKSATLLSSIFEPTSNTEQLQTKHNPKDTKDTKGTKDKDVFEQKHDSKTTLSNLFSSSKTLPDRPNIIAPEAFLSNTKKKELTTSIADAPKIVKGGKKRMRKKKLELEQQQQQQQEEEENSSKQTNGDNQPKEPESNSSNETTKDDPTTAIATPTKESKSNSKQKQKPTTKNANDRTIFVGNLPLTISRKELASIFKVCGKVESTRLRSVATMGVKLPPQKKGNQKLVRKVCANTNLVDTSTKKTAQGYVVFTDKESMPKALEMNNTQVKLAGGSETVRLRVDTAEPTIDSARTVFVGNLPYDAEEESLFLHFSTIPTNDNDNNKDDEDDKTPTNESIVERVRVIRDPTTMQCKGFGYVLFKHRESVVEGLRLHDSRYQNRTIRVQICGKRYKGRRGEEDSKHSKHHSKFEGMRSTTAAAKRILGKRKNANGAGGAGAEGSGKFIVNQKKRRTYSEKNAAGFEAKKKKTVSGMSKRAAAESKIGKRVKKLQKRMVKGMGKAKR